MPWFWVHGTIHSCDTCQQDKPRETCTSGGTHAVQWRRVTVQAEWEGHGLLEWNGEHGKDWRQRPRPGHCDPAATPAFTFWSKAVIGQLCAGQVTRVGVLKKGPREHVRNSKSPAPLHTHPVRLMALQEVLQVILTHRSLRPSALNPGKDTWGGESKVRGRKQNHIPWS